jgi:hypothetical protein
MSPHLSLSLSLSLALYFRCPLTTKFPRQKFPTHLLSPIHIAFPVHYNFFAVIAPVLSILDELYKSHEPNVNIMILNKLENYCSRELQII